MKITTRPLSRMKKVLLDPNARGPEWTYLMVRHLPLLSQKGKSCDLTVLRPNRLGLEFNKTFGHIHTSKASETYRVLVGKALFLRQQMKNRDVIARLQLTLVAAGEEITVPAGWHHEVINLGRGPLLLLNWIRKDVKNDYHLIEDQQGFGYYVVESRDKTKTFELVKNNNYQTVPKITALPNEQR